MILRITLDVNRKRIKLRPVSSDYSRHLARGKIPRKCSILPAKREKEGERKGGEGKDPLKLIIFPGCEESRICPGGLSAIAEILGNFVRGGGYAYAVFSCKT